MSKLIWYEAKPMYAHGYGELQYLHFNENRFDGYKEDEITEEIADEVVMSLHIDSCSDKFRGIYVKKIDKPPKSYIEKLIKQNENIITHHICLNKELLNYILEEEQ